MTRPGTRTTGGSISKSELSRAYTEFVCFDFESISGGTATEGTDYTKRPKVNDWIWRGASRTKRIAVVKILDDSVNALTRERTEDGRTRP